MRTATETFAALAALPFDHIRKDAALPPWSVDGWVVGTDGRLMVAFQRAGVGGDAAPVPDAYLKHVRDWMQTGNDASSTAVAASWLMGAVGYNDAIPDCDRCKNTGVVTCEECDGDGVIECECRKCGDEHSSTCDQCDDGKANCPSCEHTRRAKPASFLGAKVDVRRLVAALRVVHPEATDTLLVSVVRKGDKGAAYVVRPEARDDWRFVLMGTKDDVVSVATLEPPALVNAGATPVAQGATESA